MSWFMDAFGFDERDRGTVLTQIVEDGELLVSRANDRRMRRGSLVLATLAALRRGAASLGDRGTTTLTEVAADVTALHLDPASAGGTVQVAPQVNLLVMGDPRRVLDAAYEATLAAGALTAARTGNPVVYLTSLGAGVFGNPSGWVRAAAGRAVAAAQGYGLDARLVSYSPR